MTIKAPDAIDISRDIADLYRPPRRKKVSDAVADTMVVVDGSGNENYWDSDLTPYIREPMDTLASRRFTTVVVIGPARSGKTIGLIDGWISYVVTHDPGDFLVVQVSEEKAREYSKKRLDRTIRHSPEMRKRLSPRGMDNNVHDRTFLAGNYLGIKWPSVNVLSSSDYRFVALTDYDRLPENIDGEGDPYSLASKRTQTFLSAGQTLVETSPGWEIIDRDWKQPDDEIHAAPPTKGALALYNLGDRRRFYWQCPEASCRAWFMPTLENFNVDLARPFCPDCGGVIENPRLKRELNNGGKWVPEGCRINENGEIEGEPRQTRIASFWFEGAVAAFQTWDSLAAKLRDGEQDFEATGSQEKLKAAYNVDWGRPYLHRTDGTERTPEVIRDRAEEIPERQVPEGVRCLFAAVDVQAGRKRRFVCQVVGYGENGERWVIDRYNLRNSNRANADGTFEQIDPAGHPEDWDVLVDYVIRRRYELADGSGRSLPIHLAAIDSGGEAGVTENAYAFYRRMKRRGLNRKMLLVKGASHISAPRIRETFPDNTGRKSRHSKAFGDIPLQLLNTNLLKDAIAASLERTTPGPGYIHFPQWLPEWFFAELTYEVRDIKGRWAKPGKAANEALDLMVYAEAASIKAGYQKINWDRPPGWAQEWDRNPEIESLEESENQPAKPRRGRRQARFN